LIKVFIVDDHPLVRQGLKAFLAIQEGIEIVGEAGDGETAWEGIRKYQPDVAIIDLHLPVWNGIKLTQTIKTANLFTQVIILSSFCEDEEIIAAIDAGALSYLMKDSPPEKLVEAIWAASKGEPVLHPQIAKKLMRRVTRAEPLLEPLTLKEKEALALLVKGKSNKEIAQDLHISEVTVKTRWINYLLLYQDQIFLQSHSAVIIQLEHFRLVLVRMLLFRKLAGKLL
jgi:DNA-binding NarL/FixJ family response regulator